MNLFHWAALLLLPVVPTFAQTDGPAALPLTTFEARLSFRTSQNYPKHVASTDNLITVWKAAVPGDKIIVDPTNFTSLTTVPVLPAGVCSPGQYITVETSDIAYLPDEGTKVNLKDHPELLPHMPTISMANQSASLSVPSCTNFIGFNVTRPAGSGVVYNLIRQLGNGVLLSRNWIHGTPTDETTRGVFLSDNMHVGIVDNYFTDFHCFALVGLCGDSQAIGGGASMVSQDGDYLIQNNFLQASTEGIEIGGGPANFIPCDLTFRFNTFDKPVSWNPSDPSYAPAIAKDGLPHPWIVKNNFELKNACRVLLEGNIIGPVWGGFTQVGATILLTAKNQAGPIQGQNQCPICVVQDITIRYNHASYAGQALQVGFGTNAWGAYAAGEGNISIHDNVFDHGQYPTCSGCGSFYVQLAGGSPTLPFPNVSIVNNLFAVDGWITANMVGPNLTPLPKSGSNAFSFLTTGTANPTTASNWHLDNNIFDAGRFGVYSTGGGTSNCWTASVKIIPGVTNCWGPNSSMTGNQITQQSFFVNSYTPWPAGNGVNTIVPNAGPNMTLLNAAISNAR